MKKKSIKQKILVVILFFSVFGIALSFSELANIVLFSNSASVEARKWDISFDNLSDPVVVGGGKVVSNPVIVATNLNSLAVQLTKPGDSVSYRFDVVNNGNISAEIKALTKMNYVCESESDEASSTVICGNLVYTLSYTGGEEVKEGDRLNAKETKNLTLTIAYNKDAVELPTTNVTVKNIEFTMIYVQK